jgi:hypothetical protein
MNQDHRRCLTRWSEYRVMVWLIGYHDKALHYLELANHKAAKANAMQEAVAYFQQAISLLDTLPDVENNRRRRISLIIDQWIVFWLLFRVPEDYDLLTNHQEMATALNEAKLLARFKLKGLSPECPGVAWAYGLLLRHWICWRRGDL